MADRTHYSKAMLGHLETGVRALRREHVDAYERALGTSIGRSTVAIDDGDVALVRDAVDVLTAMGLRRGGSAVLQAVSGHLASTTAMLEEARPGSARSGLLEEHLRLLGRQAWALSEVNQPARARKVFVAALAVQEGSANTRASLRIDEAAAELRSGRPPAALRLLAEPPDVHPAIRFSWFGVVAHAHAALGNATECRRHIDRADHAWGLVDVDDLPLGLRPFRSGHAAHSHHIAGKALSALWDGGAREVRNEALCRLQLAVDAFGPDRARAVARCRAGIDRLTDT